MRSTTWSFVCCSALLVALAAARPAAGHAQVSDDRVPPPTQRVTLSGPRFGVTWLGGGIVDTLRARDIDVSALITQFGWQFERQFYAVGGGPVAVTEWVLLVGGLEQGEILPSLSWLVGIRSAKGTEFGVGPNVTPAGVALAIAGGITRRAGALNLPFSLAVVPSRAGVRVSLLGGFTTR